MWRKDLLHRSYLYKTLQVLTYVSDRLYFTQCLTSFSSIDHLLQLCARFLILYGALSIYPSAMCLSLKTLKTIIRTGLTILVKLIYLFYYIFSTSNNFTQMVNFFSWIPDCDIDSPDPFDLFHCFDASIFSTMAFLQLGNSAHVVVSFSIDSPSCSQQDVPFHPIAYNYSRANSDSLCDHLRDAPWKDIFKFNASAAASKFCKWVQVEIDVYISNRKYQVKLHLSPWFSTESAAAIVHRNHCFCLYQMNKS